MEARLDFLKTPVAREFAPGLLRAAKAVHSAGVPATTIHLMEIRASQINGCAYCVDMHTKDAAHAGEAADRINLVACWREAPHFTGPERAALALVEAATRLAGNPEGVSDDIWREVRVHYDENQAVALVGVAALINAFNRINVTLRRPAGTYIPGRSSS